MNDVSFPQAGQPVIWIALGYPFEAAPMLAALGACFIVRVWVALSDADGTARKLALNFAITAIALLFTAGWVLLQRPAPFFALMSGCGFGALGSGIILLSLNWLRRLGLSGNKAGSSRTRSARIRAEKIEVSPPSQFKESDNGKS